MTIHPAAVKEFLNKPRDSHDWIKKVSSADLDRELFKLGFTPANPKFPLFVHQKACFLLGVAYPSFAFWMDMGTGKSRLALELLQYWWDTDEVRLGIIVALSESAIIDWEADIAQWGINIPYLSLFNSSTQEKWDSVNEFEEGLIIATYAGLSRMFSKLKKKERSDKKHLVWDPTLVNKIGKKLDAIVYDEASAVAHKGSLQYRLCKQLRKKAKFVYELDGHPLGRDPTALWSQLFLIDGGETLGETLGLFREGFFTAKKNRWGRGNDYKFDPTKENKLHRLIKHRSISYSADECIDMPKLVKRVVEVSLPEEAEAYYKRFVKQIQASYAGYTERKSAFIRMRQVSSGFVGFKDDQTGERAEICFAVNPKLDRLLEMVEAIPKGRKFVIFHEFTHSGRVVSKALNDAGIRHEWLWGGTKDLKAARVRFNTDDRVKGMLVQHRLGARSLNLQRANYLFYYESPVGVVARVQSERRVRRSGQLRTVFQFDLVCRGTVDARILRFHKEGGDLFTALFKPAPAKAQGKASRART